jgi:hypothetical protein
VTMDVGLLQAVIHSGVHQLVHATAWLLRSEQQLLALLVPSLYALLHDRLLRG